MAEPGHELDLLVLSSQVEQHLGRQAFPHQIDEQRLVAAQHVGHHLLVGFQESPGANQQPLASHSELDLSRGAIEQDDTQHLL